MIAGKLDVQGDAAGHHAGGVADAALERVRVALRAEPQVQLVEHAALRPRRPVVQPVQGAVGFAGDDGGREHRLIRDRLDPLARLDEHFGHVAGPERQPLGVVRRQCAGVAAGRLPVLLHRPLLVPGRHQSVAVLHAVHELDLDAVAAGVGQRLRDLRRLPLAHLGKRGAEAQAVAEDERIGPVGGPGPVLGMRGRERTDTRLATVGADQDRPVAIEDRARLRCARVDSHVVERPRVGDRPLAVRRQRRAGHVGVDLQAAAPGQFDHVGRARTDQAGDAGIDRPIDIMGRAVGLDDPPQGQRPVHPPTRIPRGTRAGSSGPGRRGSPARRVRGQPSRRSGGDIPPRAGSACRRRRSPIPAPRAPVPPP